MIIILNGVPNAGKTTVAKALVSKLPNTVNLELDYLFAMYDWMPLSEGIGLLMENAIALIPSFTKRGLNVVISYPLDKFWYNYIVEACKYCAEVKTFLLKPPLESLLKNRGTREISESLKNRIKELYFSEINEIGIPIDNSNETEEQTAKLIIELSRIAT